MHLRAINTQPLFYAVVVFLKKWAQIKNDIPIRNKGLANRKQPAKERKTEKESAN
jgi:hypothetical protein